MTPKDLGTTQVQFAELVSRLSPVVTGILAWFQGPVDGTVNNGSVDLPTLAKLISDVDPAGLALTGSPLDVEADDVGVPAIANPAVNAIASALLQLIGFLKADKLSISDFDTDSTLTAASDTRVASQKATKSFVESLLVALWRDRGNYDASSNLWPSTGGTGIGGAIKAGNFWTVSVAGELGGAEVGVGDTFRALVDDPGQTANNWAALEGNIGYVPLNAANNLSDLASAPSARSALGLGALAVASLVSNVLLQDQAVTLAKIQDIATAHMLGRKTAGSGAPEALSLSDVLDLIGDAAQGDMLYRDGASWARLAAGGAGKILQSNGSAAPTWEDKPAASALIVKSSDQTVTNSTTFVDESDLQLALEAGKKYQIKIHIAVAVQGSGTMKWEFDGPASPTKSEFSGVVMGPSGGASVTITSTFPTGNPSITLSSGALMEFSIYVENGSNAGNLIFRFAQQTSSANPCTVKAGSWLEYREVA